MLIQIVKNAPNAFGGIETVARNFAVACDEIGEESIYLWRAGFKFFILGSRRDTSLRKQVSIKEIMKIFKVENPILLIHYPSLSILWSFFLLIHTKKHICFYHCDVYRFMPLGPFLNKGMTMILKILKFKMICHSRKYYESSWQVSSNLYKQIRNVPHKAQDSVLCETILSQKKYDYIFIGRKSWYKNIDYTVKIISNAQASLALVGSGFSKCDYANYSNVDVFTDISEHEKNTILKASKFLILLSTSRAEAFGIAIVEAKMYGIPVVVNNCSSGVKDVTGDQLQGGFLVDLRHSSGVIKQLRELASMKTCDYEVLSKAARRDYETRFAWDVFVNDVRDLIR